MLAHKMIEDRRKLEDSSDHQLWLVATDRVLSDWSYTGIRRSYVAISVPRGVNADHFMRWMQERRTDWNRFRLNQHFPRPADDIQITILDRAPFLFDYLQETRNWNSMKDYPELAPLVKWAVEHSKKEHERYRALWEEICRSKRG